MAVKTLGKGLGELLGASMPSVKVQTSSKPSKGKSSSAAIEGLQEIAIDAIHPGPFQPREVMNPEALEQLSASIKAQGVIQPIVVRARKDGAYEIIAGERRWRASTMAGLKVMPCVVRAIDDASALAMALIENIQREDLNCMEQARALKRLCDELKLTHQQVADAVGKSRANISNMLRLLQLHKEVQLLVEQGQLEMGHARALLALKGPVQAQVARAVIEKKLSVRETERLVVRAQEAQTQQAPTPKKKADPNVKRLQRQLSELLGTKVNIHHTSRGAGSVVIPYTDLDELQGILDHFVIEEVYE